MKLHPRKGGHGHVTAYAAMIGSLEARRAGFITDDGERMELEKVVDEEAKTITIRITQQAEAKQGG